METKVCSSCKESLALEKFSKNKSRKDGLCHACKSCQSKKYQKWADKTPESKNRQAQWQAARKEKARAFYVEALRESNGCDKCGYKKNIAALVFDHRPGFEKVGGVAQLVNSGSALEKIALEMVKCDLLCWNCHAEVTAARGGFWTTTVTL